MKSRIFGYVSKSFCYNARLYTDGHTWRKLGRKTLVEGSDRVPAYQGSGKLPGCAQSIALLIPDKLGGHIKLVTLKPVSRIFRVRIFCVLALWRLSDPCFFLRLRGTFLILPVSIVAKCVMAVLARRELFPLICALCIVSGILQGTVMSSAAIEPMAVHKSANGCLQLPLSNQTIGLFRVKFRGRRKHRKNTHIEN